MTSSATPKYFQTMSPAPIPQPSALPPSPSPQSLEVSPSSSTAENTHSEAVPTPQRKPLLRLEIRDLSSPGTHAFLRLLHASDTVAEAVDTVLKLLYSGLPQHCIPPTRSVTLVLRSMGGVAYTTGKDLDSDHKEIHFSTDYINAVPESRQKEEMRGVIVHEMVHCWQHNAFGSAPGGLIEGIADWVRLKANLGPPHWKRHADGNWDSGYERTGFFLEWLEKEHGLDIVRKVNESLRDCKYEEKAFWHKCCGRSITSLWEKYKASLEDSSELKEDERESKTENNGSISAGDDATTTAKEGTVSDNSQTDNERNRTSTQASGEPNFSREKARTGGNIISPIRPKQIDT